MYSSNYEYQCNQSWPLCAQCRGTQQQIGVRPGKRNVGTSAHVGQLSTAWHTGSRLLLPLAVLDGGTDNNDNPSELQLEANRPPIIFLYISFRLRPFSQIICVEFLLCFCKLDKLGKYFVLLTSTLVCLINGETQKTGRWGVNYFIYSIQGRVQYFFLSFIT